MVTLRVPGIDIWVVGEGRTDADARAMIHPTKREEDCGLANGAKDALPILVLLPKLTHEHSVADRMELSEGRPVVALNNKRIRHGNV